MKIAKNDEGKFISILASYEDKEYFCIACGEKLERIFTPKRQYFKHPKGISDECERKIKNMNISGYDEGNSEKDEVILKNELYDKSFNYMNTDLSDYKSEEDYYLTEEQKTIIFSKENKIKIQAVAGSSKTTTLYYYAKERPDKNILYIVYNKAAKDEAENTFGKLDNVTIKTIHGLAFGYCGFKYSKANKLIQGNYSAYDVCNDLNIRNDLDMAIKILKGYNYYLLSDLYDIKDIDIFNEDINKSKILNYIDLLFGLKMSLNNNIKIEHDFYLKLFHLKKQNLSDKYDIVLLDESQDSSLLTLDLINNSKINGVVMVGDFLQQLYSWRNAINIMNKFEAKEYNLSTSFRISNNVAFLADLFLKQFLDIDRDMKGFNNKNKFVDKINYNKKHAILCRTNSVIFKEAFNAVEENKKIFFEGGYYAYKFEILNDAYEFYKTGKTNNSMFKKYNSYSHMMSIATQTDDVEIIILDYLIKKYSVKIPSLINSVKNNSVKSKDVCDVLLTTIHKSKGQTYNFPIKISADHLSLSSTFDKKFIKNEDVGSEEIFEELCIIYVAITRGSKEIELSCDLKNYFISQFNYFSNKEE